MALLHYLRLKAQRYFDCWVIALFSRTFTLRIWHLDIVLIYPETIWCTSERLKIIYVCYRETFKSNVAKLQWLGVNPHCAQNIPAFTAKQAKGLTCWRHNDRHEGMQTSSFCYLMGMKNTQTRIFTMPPMPLCLVRNGHKGQNWKASAVKFVYTGLGFCFWLMEQEIQARRFNSVLKERVIVHSLKKKSCLAFPSFTLLFSLLSS